MKFSLIKEIASQGPLTFHVTGVCMLESVPVGSDVRLEGARLYLPGDIVAFKRGNDDVVSHRFLGYVPGRMGWRMITRADSSSHADAPVLLQHVLGRITRVNGKPYRPGIMLRMRAMLAWIPAVTRLTLTLAVTRIIS